MNLTFLINIFSGFFLTGLIWVIQLVHYPTFRFIPDGEFKRFEKFHQMRIAVIASPLMLMELVSSVILCFSPDTLTYLFYWNLILVLFIWVSTFFIQIPCHLKLKKGKDFLQIKKLIQTNQIRTILWTIRSGLLIYILISYTS